MAQAPDSSAMAEFLESLRTWNDPIASGMALVLGMTAFYLVSFAGYSVVTLSAYLGLLVLLANGSHAALTALLGKKATEAAPRVGQWLLDESAPDEDARLLGILREIAVYWDRTVRPPLRSAILCESKRAAAEVSKKASKQKQWRRRVPYYRTPIGTLTSSFRYPSSSTTPFPLLSSSGVGGACLVVGLGASACDRDHRLLLLHCIHAKWAFCIVTARDQTSRSRLATSSELAGYVGASCQQKAAHSRKQEDRLAEAWWCFLKTSGAAAFFFSFLPHSLGAGLVVIYGACSSHVRLHRSHKSAKSERDTG